MLEVCCEKDFHSASANRFIICLFWVCKQSDSLKLASAGNIKGDYIPSEIEVSDIDRGTYTVEWTALTIDGKKYKCSADDMVRRVSCKQR